MVLSVEQLNKLIQHHLDSRPFSIAEVSWRKVTAFEQSHHGCPSKGIRAPLDLVHVLGLQV
jgi:hypothetical protein